MTGGERRLFLGPVPSDFDPARDVAIGPWCFIDTDHPIPGWEDLDPHDTLTDPEEIATAARRVRRLAECTALRLGPEFNRRHGVAYGDEYWRVLLLHLGQATWKRSLHMERFTARYRDVAFTVPVAEGEPDWRFHGIPELQWQLLYTHGFNFWLNSKLVRHFSPSTWTFVPQPLPPASTARSRQPPPVPRWRGWLRRRLSEQRCRQVKGIRWSSFAVSSLLAARPPVASPPPRRRPCARGEVEALFPPEFLDLFKTIVARAEPDTVKEQFRNLDARAGRRRYRAGKLNVVGPCMVTSEEDRFALAHAADKDERLVCTQHGGNGFLKVAVNSSEVESKQEAYLSWGWRSREGFEGKIVPLPSPFLSGYASRHRRKEDTLYLIGSELRIFGYRLDTYYQPGQAIAARRDRRSFLAALPPHLFAATRYRPYPRAQGTVPDEPYFTAAFPDLRICRGPLEPQLLTGRLAVIDHPSTTLMVTLAANMPTIAFWDPGVWTMTEEAAPLFDGLRDAGLVFDDGPAAAARVAAVWDDIDAWWGSGEVQRARRAFCARYAAADRFWLLHWMSALWRLARNRGSGLSR